jgi:hypothetical protein
MQRTGTSTATPLIDALVIGFGGLVIGDILIDVVAFGLEMVGVPLFETLAVAVSIAIVVQGIGSGLGAVAYLRYRGIGIDYILVQISIQRDILWIGGKISAMFALLTVLNSNPPFS